MNHTTITRRATILLTVAAFAVLLAPAAAVLALHARGDERRLQRLADDDLVLANSVAEARALTLQLRLSAAQAALTPRDPLPAARFRSDRAQLADELRRARLHAGDPNTVDVIDDVENRLLAFGETGEKVLAAAAAGRSDEARIGLAVLDDDSARVMELVDELTTVAATTADRGARDLSGGARPLGLLALALAGVILAVHTGTLAATECGAALAAAVAAPLPDSWRGRVPGYRPRAVDPDDEPYRPEYGPDEPDEEQAGRSAAPLPFPSPIRTDEAVAPLRASAARPWGAADPIDLPGEAAAGQELPAEPWAGTGPPDVAAADEPAAGTDRPAGPGAPELLPDGTVPGFAGAAPAELSGADAPRTTTAA